MIEFFLDKEGLPPHGDNSRNFVGGDRVITLDEFFGEMRGMHYILIGENEHCDPLMIDTQLSMLKAAFRHNPEIVVGIELLASHQQQGLVDSYLNGDINLEQLAHSSYFGPETVRVYKDMLEFARLNGVRVVPLSATGEEAFGLPKEEIQKLTLAKNAALLLKGIDAHDDIMVGVLSEIQQQVLVCLGALHTHKQVPNLTKNLREGSFVTGQINNHTFKDSELDNRVLVYSPANPNYKSLDYIVIRTRN